MKIEFDIPEFKKELKIEITIRRDGEVIYCDTASTSDADRTPAVDNKVDNKTTRRKSPASSSKPADAQPGPAFGLGGGNMMNIGEF